MLKKLLLWIYDDVRNNKISSFMSLSDMTWVICDFMPHIKEMAIFFEVMKHFKLEIKN